MNTIEKALMHALFIHLHHNIDKAIDFKSIDKMNKKVSKIFPKAMIVGPCGFTGKCTCGKCSKCVGEINDDDKEVFEYKGKTVAVIPNHPTPAEMKELQKES